MLSRWRNSSGSSGSTDSLADNSCTNGNSLEHLAIDVSKVNLSYGFGPSKVIVLSDLSLELPRGSIYGLLGESGCGKTSLIRCILGTLKYHSGSITVFGHKPGGKRSSVPGRWCGYMPQDTSSLYPDLTIGETLLYFGSLYGMEETEATSRAQFLISFLNLPDSNRFVAYLSGGQLRRVSLAVALIHSPPLLVLDEPTVGICPLLRKSIWDYLVEISKRDRMTVLITTHYIEEAKNADLVGLMRGGRLLEENSPKKLISKYRVETLEDVFLKLCNRDNEQIEQRFGTPSTNTQTQHQSTSINSTNEPEEVKVEQLKLESVKVVPTKPLAQIGAIVKKNLRTLSRSPGYLLFQFMLPVLEAIIFCLCLGNDIKSIHIAVYDGDNSRLSLGFLRELDPSVLIQQREPSSALAISSVAQTSNVAAIIISPHFADCLVKRIAQSGNVAPDVLYNSTIHVMPDMAEQYHVFFAFKEIVRAFNEITRQVLREIGQNPDMIAFPVQYGPPVYGPPDPSVHTFLTPGAVISIAFFAALSLTTMNLVIEKKRGLVERTIVVGVSHFRILFSHLVTHTFILLIQAILLLLMFFTVYAIPYEGSLTLIAALVISQSLCGMCFGLFVSTVANSENTATMLSLGVFYPMLLISGTMWPVSGMHVFFKTVSLFLPITIPILSLKSLMIRGYGLMHWDVANGFIVTYTWIAIFIGASVLLMRFKK